MYEMLSACTSIQGPFTIFWTFLAIVAAITFRFSSSVCSEGLQSQFDLFTLLYLTGIICSITSSVGAGMITYFSITGLQITRKMSSITISSPG
jgi:hypothetical protein